MFTSTRETQRLWLYPSKPDLADSVLQYYARNKAFLKEFDPIRDETFYSWTTQAAMLVEDCCDKNRCRFWIAKKETPLEIIGMTALSNIVRGSFQSCFLSYKLDENELNRGYTTEAVACCVDFGFDGLGLHRIEANILPRNRPSLRVVEKLGFINEGLSRKYLEIDGVWQDHVHMVLLRDERRF